MSIERRWTCRCGTTWGKESATTCPRCGMQRKGGDRRVRWRAGGRNRSLVTGPSKKDAVAVEQEVTRNKRIGSIVPDEMGKANVIEFGYRFDDRHISRKAKKTRTLYRYLWDKHILPTFGPGKLSDITVGAVEDWLTAMERKGVGREAQRKSLGLLVLALNKAIAWGELQTNPAAAVSKPKHRPKPVTPPTPKQVEEIRGKLIEQERPGDACLVSVLSYAGLRPQEALSLVWADIGDRTILVGSEHKTGSRSVKILSPLARDLAEWKLACGGKHELVFPNAKGQQWSENLWNTWRERVWYGRSKRHSYPGVAPLGLHPYTLRHSFASLLIREGLSVVEVAQQLGHSPSVCLSTYAHTFAELGGTGSAEDAIRAARAEVHGSQEHHDVG